MSQDVAAALDGDGYDRFRRAADSHRAELVVRLAGEAGLRPGEMADLRVGDVTEHEPTGAAFAALAEREAYLPPDVAHDYRQFTAGDGPDAPVFGVSARRLQMLVREVGAAAADRLDDDRFRAVSSAALRERFARTAVGDRGVPLEVVASVAGYERLAPLARHAPEPNRERVATAFAEGVAGGAAPPRLRRTVAVAADVGETLAAAESAPAIRAAVCERLADAEGYAFALVVDPEPDPPVVRTRSGLAEAAADRLVEAATGLRTAAERAEPRTLEGPTPAGAAVAIPLVHEGVADGVLVVGAEATSVSDAERDLLRALGAQVGHALAAVERKRRLLADSVTELDLSVPEAPLVAAAAALDCTFELEGLVPGGEGPLCFLFARATTPDAVLSYAREADGLGDARLVREDAEGTLVELRLPGSPLATLTDRDVRVEAYRATPDGADLVATTSTGTDVRALVEALREAHPGAGLVARREVDRPVETDAGFRERLGGRLTGKQDAALRAAYFGGYFEWPRESTAEELADSLGVASPTLHNHLRVAQSKLLDAFYDPGRGDRPPESLPDDR